MLSFILEESPTRDKILQPGYFHLLNSGVKRLLDARLTDSIELWLTLTRIANSRQDTATSIFSSIELWREKFTRRLVNRQHRIVVGFDNCVTTVCLVRFLGRCGGLRTGSSKIAVAGSNFLYVSGAMFQDTKVQKINRDSALLPKLLQKINLTIKGILF